MRWMRIGRDYFEMKRRRQRGGDIGKGSKRKMRERKMRKWIKKLQRKKEANKDGGEK